MRDTIKGAVITGAVQVAAGVSVLLAQTPTWTTPRTWATDDLLTATQFNAQFRDNLLWLRQDAQLTGTPALLDLGCGTLGTNEVLFSDCTWATIPDQTPADNSITTVKLADDAVTQPKIADDAVGRDQLTNGLVECFQAEPLISRIRKRLCVLSTSRTVSMTLDDCLLVTFAK